MSRCADCHSKNKPLKWYHYWSAWLCYPCNETRITKFKGVL